MCAKTSKQRGRCARVSISKALMENASSPRLFAMHTISRRLVYPLRSMSSPTAIVSTLPHARRASSRATALRSSRSFRIRRQLGPRARGAAAFLAFRSRRDAPGIFLQNARRTTEVRRRRSRQRRWKGSDDARTRIERAEVHLLKGPEAGRAESVGARSPQFAVVLRAAEFAAEAARSFSSNDAAEFHGNQGLIVAPSQF